MEATGHRNPAAPQAGWPPQAAASGFWRWQRWLPVPAGLQPVTLGEGGTPLMPARAWPGVFWKAEFRNPTGSHKDRPLALAASHALASGARLFTVFSAGSTGISAAAYAARAGLRCAVLMTRGAPLARVAPVGLTGAVLLELDTPIDDGLAALAALSGRGGIYVASTTRSHNPVQAEAARTIAYEIVADLGRAPDRVIVPTGGGGTIAALHDGFVQLRDMGLATQIPELIAVVPETYANLQRALDEGVAGEDFFALPDPPQGPTVLNKIAHAHPPDGVHALRALRESGGRVLAYSDAAALAAVPALGAEEGIYLEPSSAIARCALQTLAQEGRLPADGATVVLACGSGFRETHVLLDRPDLRPVAADTASLEATLMRLVEP